MNRLAGAITASLLCTTSALAQDAGVFTLDEIIYSAGLTALEASRVGVTVDVIEQDELTEAGDMQLADFLATVPGVNVVRNGGPGTNTNLSIRGAGGGSIGVYIDGILVNDPTATSGQYNGFGGLTAGSIRRVEILRGSQSAVYGGSAVGGVISISTVASEPAEGEITQNYLAEAGSYGTARFSYDYTQGAGPLTLTFGVSHAQTDGFSAAEENNGNTEADAFSSSRISLGTIYQVSPSFMIGANTFFETTKAEFDEFVGSAPGDGTPGDDEGSSQTLGARAFAKFEIGDWTHDLSVTRLDTQRTSQSLTVESGAPFDSEFDGERTGLQYLASTDAVQNLVLSFGLDWREDSATFTNISGGSRSITTRGIFAEAVWATTSDLDLFFSLRNDDNSAYGEKTTGRLAFSYRVTGATTLRGALATGFRPPSLSELYGDFPFGTSRYVGNPDLQPEESISYELGIDQRLGNRGVMSATAFRLELDNFIRFQDCVRDPEDDFNCVPTSEATQVNIAGVSTIQGLELGTEMPLADWLSFRGSYTYTDARQENGTRLNRIPRHNLALGLDADFDNGWSATATLRAVEDLMDTSRRVGDDYTTIDASVGYAVNDVAEVYFRIENVLDEEYQTVRGYGASDRAFYLGIRGTF